MYSILYLLPKNALSRCVGSLLNASLPGPLRRLSMRLFARAYQIDLNEAEKPLESYVSIGDLFVRRLRPGARPLEEGLCLHPADAKISQMGRIEKGRIIQAKGRNYSVEELLVEPGSLAKWEGGLFVTYYLCPTDYHRVHSPVKGRVHRVTHVPGALWPVNAWSVEHIDRLFCVNERLVVSLETEGGEVAVVLVGATNVGKMSLHFDPRVATNLANERKVRNFRYDPPVALEKGDELGAFHMGSTVVLCLPKSYVEASRDKNWDSWVGKSSRVGGRLL